MQELGSETALAFLTQTHETEAAGGMLLPDGSRKRTPGGVYFVLVKQHVTPEQRKRIFPYPSFRKYPERERQPGVSPATQERRAPVTSFSWAEREQVLDEADQQRGEVRTVKVTLIGRPGQVVERGACVALSMQQGPKIPSLPAGLPFPPVDQVEATRYSVYIASKQWKKVAEALTNPEDVLIVEGWQVLDQQRGTIAVFGSNVTTKLLQMAIKQKKTS